MSNPVKLFFILLLVSILTFPAAAPIYGQDEELPIIQTQPYQQDIRFEHLTTDDGLSHNIVWSILEDSQGFMWFGTIDGLNRYDGYKMKVYRHDPEDPNSLSTNPLRIIFEDQSGDIWIGTSGGGLNRFDHFKENFTRYQHDPEDPDSLSGNDVRTIFEDRSGGLWIGTSSGLNRYDRQTDSFTQFRHDPDDQQSLGNDFVQSVVEDRSGMIWIGTWGSGLDRLDPKTGVFTHFHHDPENPDSLSNDYVWVVIEDQNGNIWAGTNGGLNKLISEEVFKGNARFLRYQHDPDDPDSLSDNTVRSILEDQEGNLWVGTFGGTINILDRERDAFIHYANNPFVGHSLSKGGVISLFEDHVGSLWIGTAGGGINIIDRNAKPFNLYHNNPMDPESLSDNSVRSILVDHEGVLWIGTENGGLNRSKQGDTKPTEKMAFIRYQYDAQKSSGLSDNFVWSIDQDREGFIWIGTEAGGLNRFDPDTETFNPYQYDPGEPNSVSSNSIRSVLIDQSGLIWLGHRGSGLDRFDPKTGTITNFRHNPNDPLSLSANTVRVIYEDTAGKLWIGTIDGGLNLYDRSTNTFVHYKNDRSDPSSLSDNSVRAILEDKAGDFWIGTWGGGLNKMDREQGTFTHYREKDGLANDVIWGILEDSVPAEEGGPYLWISTNQGLSRFDSESETFRNYDVQDGLQGNSFYSALAMTNEGELFFGGANGFNAFNPVNILDNPHVPPIVITDFQLANRPVPIGEDSALKKSITETDELLLSYQDRVVSFEFAALSYTAPDKNRYRYKLEGFEDEWNEVGSDRRFITYTNLDPGEYILRVTGSNNDGVWNEEGATLKITITPPWWGTIWFRGGLILLLIGLVSVAYYLRMRSYRARSLELEAEVADKTRDLQEEISEHEATEARLRRTRDELTTSLAISRELVSTLELEPLLDLILEDVRKVITYDAAGILTVNNNKLEFQAYRGLRLDADIESLVIPMDGVKQFTNLVRGRQAFLIDDLKQEAGLAHELQVSTGAPLEALFGTLHSWMGVPMIAREKVIGLLTLAHQTPGYYQTNMLELAQAFANQAAIAIENARLYRQTQAAAVAEERNRLARDLHDSTTQSLYSALLYSESGKKLTQQGDLESAAHYQSQVSSIIHEALKEMRLLVFEMRPLALEEEGLVGALQMRLDAVESRSGMDARLYADDLPALTSKMREGLYRITQEALNNALKHAKAEAVAVYLECDNNMLTMQIVDDGQGFVQGSVQESGGMGLTNMHQRSDELGGQLTIDSKPGEGTRVVVRVPLEERK